MDDATAVFIVIMTAMLLVAGLAYSWIRGRAQAKAAAGSSIEASREVHLLSNENAGLKSQIGRLEERLAVLERIATDPGARTAYEIEQLR